MKQSVNEWDFIDAFKQAGREDNFSYEGLKALFEYLEEYEDSTGEELELDVVAICCDFTEYEDLKELQDNYSDIEDMDDLQDHTTVIMINDENFIIQDF